MASLMYPAVLEAQNTGLHNDTVWSYWGQATGGFSVFPGTSFGNAYDPTRRPWVRFVIGQLFYFENHHQN